jgi:hypothetical protein
LVQVLPVSLLPVAGSGSPVSILAAAGAWPRPPQKRWHLDRRGTKRKRVWSLAGNTGVPFQPHAEDDSQPGPYRGAARHSTARSAPFGMALRQ